MCILYGYQLPLVRATQAEILILEPYKDSPDQAGRVRLGSCTLRERGVLRKDKYSGFTR
ncbi:hypothetical protein V8C44DRAFT_324071 [Trichoderma aethiopicum]